jgi:EmrB/QacA subfamily drug resistance transporter
MLNQTAPTFTSDKDRQRAILIATCTALMAVIASVSGLNVAQQEVAIDLGASQSTVLWIINAYTVTLAAMLLPVGAIGDRWGRRPVLLTGLVLFGIASVASALAPTTGSMIIARLVAGLAAAMIMPVTLSVITATFPEGDRSQAIGVWTAVAGGGGLLGMFASALLVDLASWRWLFAPPIALAVVAFIMSARAIPNSREQADEPFDLGGSVLSMIAVGSLVFAIHNGPEHGWIEPLTIIFLTTGIIAVIAFIVWESRRREPLLDVSVFADRRLASGATALVSVFGVLGGIFVVLFPYFQAVLGWSALRSMGAMLPMALGMMISSGFAPKVASRVGLRTAMLVGVGIAGVGLALMASFVSVDGGYLSVLPGMLVMAAGFGLTMTPSTEAITMALPAERQGVASALNDATREIGTALGVASLGAVLSAGYRTSIHTLLDGNQQQLIDAVAEGIGTAYAIAGQTGDSATIIASAQQAFVDGWSQAMWVGVAVTAILFVFVLFHGPVQLSSEGRRNTIHKAI